MGRRRRTDTVAGTTERGVKTLRTHTGLIFNKITQPKADALTLAEDTVIDYCIFDFRSIPLSEQDEIVRVGEAIDPF